jgi:hypothetical protein
MKKLISLLSLSLAVIPASAAVPPAEKLLPDDTLVVISVPDFTRAREVYRTSPAGRFWSDPAMKPFADKFMNKLQSEFLAPLEHDLGVHFGEYSNYLQGQLTLAVVQNGWQGKEKDPNELAYIFLLDTRDKSSQLKSAIADLKKKWVDAGKTARVEKIRDVDFSLVVLTTNDIPKSLRKKPAPSSPDAPEPMEDPDAKNFKKQLYIGQSDSLLIIGNASKPIEKILAAMSGGSVKTLSDVPAFGSSSAMFRDATSFGWANVKAFLDIFLRKSEDDSAPNPFGIDPAKVVAALGFGGLKTIAFDYHTVAGGAQTDFLLGVPESERTGLFKIIAGEPKDFNPPPFVPTDAVKFQRWRISGPKTWDAIRQIVADASPANAGTIDIMVNSAEAAAKDKDPDFDFKKSFISNLGDDFINYQKNPRKATFEDLSTAPSIFLIGSPNPEKLGTALKLIASSFMQPPTEREFLGHKIVTFPTPAPPRQAKGAPPAHNNGLSYTCNSGYVAISSDPAMLEEFLRSSGGDTKSLRDASGLADAAQKVGGGGTSIFGYSNESENMRVLLEAMKNAAPGADPFAKLGALAMMGGMNTGDTKFSDWVDLSLLPPFAQISKYFYFSVFAGRAAPEGIYFKSFSPAPPGLK